MILDEKMLDERILNERIPEKNINNKYHVLGTTPVRKDGYEKVTGKARYAADMYIEGMVFGGALSAGIPNGKIISMDISEAVKIPGVLCVLTPGDIHKQISVSSHRYITDRPRFCGDVVALVAAETQAAVDEAIRSIRVEYAEYPAVYTIKDALKEDAPRVRDEYPGNVFTDASYCVRKGNVDAVWEQCDMIVEREYESQRVEHVYIEPEAAVAYTNPADGLITVHCCCQAPYYVRRYTADMLEIPISRVRVVQETIGGTFGGKEDGMGMMAARCAFLSHYLNKPVKWVYRREESIERTGKRHPYLFQYKIGLRKDGKILAWEGTQTADSGAYSNHTKFVNWRANVHSCGVYDIENVKMDTRAVFTNSPPSGAFRGYSSPQLLWAQEQLIDELAEEVGISEVEFRRINRLKEGSHAVTDAPVQNVTIGEVMDLTVEQTDYLRKREAYKKQKGRYRKGIGMAISHRGCGFGAESPDAAGTMIIANEDGTVTINNPLTENGQGMRTAFTMIAAEALGIPYENVYFYGGDTQSIPDGSITAASRGTTAGSRSVRLAAEELNLIMRNHAIELGFFENCGPEDLEIVNGYVQYRLSMMTESSATDGTTDRNKKISFSELCTAALWTGRQMSVFKWHRPEDFVHDHAVGKGQAFRSYSFGCVIAEVEVDTATGYVTVERITAAHDVGKAVHPELVKGQIYGGVVMGMGYGITEELELRKGLVANKNLDSYIIPTAMDLPDIRVNIYEGPDQNGTYGAKSIGEPATETVAPAIANAVYHATGRRLRTNPASLENVLLGHKLSK